MNATASSGARAASVRTLPMDVAKRVWPFLASLFIVGAITWLYRYLEVSNEAVLGFTFLLAVLCASAVWDFSVAFFMSLAAALAYDYFFLPPVGTLNLNDPMDWVALAAFLITAAIGSRLSTRARAQAREANRRRKEVELLYTFSQKLLRTHSLQELYRVIPEQLVETFDVSGAALFVSGVRQSYYAGDSSPDGEDISVAEFAGLQEAVLDLALGRWLLPVGNGTQKIATISLSGTSAPRSTLEAIALVVGLLMERTQAVDRAAHLEALQEGERLKSALLDAVTHEFRTPLTSIRAAITGLLGDIHFDRDQSRELLAIIDEESARMNQLIGKAFDMSRLEAGEVKLELASHPVHELISRALETCKGSLRNRPVQLEVPEPGAKVVADASLIENVLVHLIENANLYSPEREPITVAARPEDGLVWFSVADRGPGIRESEREKIFEKFYRGEDQRDQVVGSGMGLSIVKAIVMAHGGNIEIVNLPARGAEFTFSLPADPRKRTAGVSARESTADESTQATAGGNPPTDP